MDVRDAPDAAAVKAGRRPPPEAARSGLDGGEVGAMLLDRSDAVHALSAADVKSWTGP